MTRCRLFSKENTFWAFFGQVLDADGGCKEVIRKLQSYASIKGIEIPSSSTASYCTARKKLNEQMLSEILDHTASQLNKKPKDGLLNNRRVIVVDGTGVSMPDTPGGQECQTTVVFTEARVWVSDGPYLRLFLAGKWSLA